MTENESEVIESQQTQLKMVKATSTLNETASVEVVSQMSELIWCNI